MLIRFVGGCSLVYFVVICLVWFHLQGKKLCQVRVGVANCDWISLSWEFSEQKTKIMDCFFYIILNVMEKILDPSLQCLKFWMNWICVVRLTVLLKILICLLMLGCIHYRERWWHINCLIVVISLLLASELCEELCCCRRRRCVSIMTDLTCGIFDVDKIETYYGKWLTPKWLRQSLGKQYKMFILWPHMHASSKLKTYS